ncbi:TetR/AcrR family transcriptional regulator [Isoptericola sp. b441]|uniref:TetR/AcrR family transcriptional regulator n=1 Tax=Actinotalea lenta TaxID=3064654 RepID=A0ABT9DC18_9CELL|nr:MULTISPECIES: TetR/AcrR family transcriptional regulator [unclassified Isoptericola]MDO8106723.1 TetR/AcrR family transcriptional regulator [Isoptericola sp. b441]MDO8121565.1 TetR/AcrR family transcriptional regulator [Isoptericola sp. b490]
MARRRDARRNRERLLAAAREVFAESGASAPLDLVARRAGVGRGTLYRNFADRSALLAALFEERLGLLEEILAQGADDVFEQLVVEICWYELRMPGFGAVLTSLPMLTNPDLVRVTRATERLLVEALRRSVAAGLLRDDLVPGDALTVIAMLNGVIIAGAGGAPDESAALRALELLLDGVRAAGRVGAPVPAPVLGPQP